jgi:hypothetical protein
MSDTVAGIGLIVAGLGLLWSARAYVETRRESQRVARAAWERERGGKPPWWAMFVVPLKQRTELGIAYAIGVAVIVGGVLVLV